jgi:hypothetical protein
MRNYPRNSPQAAGRLVALGLMADGHVCSQELRTLERLGASARLGLPPDGLSALLHTLCEDLLAGAAGSAIGLGPLGDAELAALLSEVDDPALQREVLALLDAAARADGHLAEAENALLAAATRHWGPAALGMPVREAA